MKGFQAKNRSFHHQEEGVEHKLPLNFSLLSLKVKKQVIFDPILRPILLYLFIHEKGHLSNR
jgi:hypothetical protein